MIIHDNAGESTPLLLDTRCSGTKRSSSAASEATATTTTTNRNQASNRTHTYPIPASDQTGTNQYPRAVYFVLVSKFFESFAANGVRSILALYLRDSLHYAEDFSTAMLHIFNFFGQFCPIFGAVLADSYIGNVSTIFHFMFLYATGWLGMVAVTLIGAGDGPVLPLLFGALVLIAIGNGSIRACISALGGSQFAVPAQAAALQRYFTQYYFIYYGGILLSKIVPPAVRSSTQCLGREDCYAAVFGMLAVVFFMCWLMFLCGLPHYRAEPQPFSKANILGKVSGCVWHGLQRRLSSTRPPPVGGAKPTPRRRWIDGAIGAYTEEFVDDVWDYLRVVLLFVPLPVYFALLAQQDSTWTFQATQLDTRVLGVDIEADQAKAVGPVIMLILIPVWENIGLPLLWRCGGIAITPLRSITMGGLCAAAAFLCATVLQLSIEQRVQLGGQLAANSSSAVLSSAVPLLLDLVASGGAPPPLPPPPPTISILWQIPQFTLLMLGEVLLSIPGLQFAFTEAPATMKSVLAATWFLNNAAGNLMVVVLTELHWFRRPSTVFAVYTALMLASVLAFVALAGRYEYRAERQRQRQGLRLAKAPCRV